MRLEEFKELCNEYVRLEKIQFSSVQAQDLYDVFQQSAQTGLTNSLTPNNAKLMIECYFKGYNSGWNAGDKATF